MQAFSGCVEQGPLSSFGVRLLIVVASLVVEHRLQGLWASVVAACGLSSCGARALLPCGMWDLPRPGMKPILLHW